MTEEKKKQKIIVVRDIGDGWFEGVVKLGREVVPGSRTIFNDSEDSSANAAAAGTWTARQLGWKPPVAEPAEEGANEGLILADED